MASVEITSAATEMEKPRKVHFSEEPTLSDSLNNIREPMAVVDSKLLLPGKVHGRKRSKSFCSSERDGKKSFYKHRRFSNSASNIVPPSKFLLGGSISDPLNLGGLTDEKSRETPNSSPISTPKHREIEVRIPPNIRDPLNLDGNLQENARKKGRKKYGKNQQDNVSGSETKTSGQSNQNSLNNKQNSMESVGGTPREKRTKDRIVSPVIRQPGTRRRNYRSLQEDDEKTGRQGKCSTKEATRPRFNPQNSKFQYGNYNRYYGYRNAGNEDDRLKCFEEEWFKEKDVLDIGCNIGHITLLVARDYKPKKMVGMDIDERLIVIARKNIKYYYSKGTEEFPGCMESMYGPLKTPAIPESQQDLTSFPHNVVFVLGNYVLDSDKMLELVRPEFDCIMCLSTIKWIHLNFGDAGLKRAFRRMYLQLRPGGRLILELQAWSSYRKKKTLTERIWKNFKEIRLLPDKFKEFLLSEVGFSRCDMIGTPQHHSKGFRRSIFLFTKSNNSIAMNPVRCTNTAAQAVSTATSATEVVDTSASSCTASVITTSTSACATDSFATSTSAYATEVVTTSTSACSTDSLATSTSAYATELATTFTSACATDAVATSSACATEVATTSTSACATDAVPTSTSACATEAVPTSTSACATEAVPTSTSACATDAVSTSTSTCATEAVTTSTSACATDPVLTSTSACATETVTISTSACATDAVPTSTSACATEAVTISTSACATEAVTTSNLACATELATTSTSACATEAITTSTSACATEAITISTSGCTTKVVTVTTSACDTEVVDTSASTSVTQVVTTPSLASATEVVITSTMANNTQGTTNPSSSSKESKMDLGTRLVQTEMFGETKRKVSISDEQEDEIEVKRCKIDLEAILGDTASRGGDIALEDSVLRKEESRRK